MSKKYSMMHLENMAGSYTKKDFGPEEQALLKENGTGKIHIQGPVKLTPCLEGLDSDDLNFRRNKMETLHLDIKQPKDRLNIIYIIMILHGIGALLPWNMFITAKDYFSEYKLSDNYTGGGNHSINYAGHSQTMIGVASQIPNVLFSWLNIFLPLGGNLTVRVVWGIFVEGVIFVLTVVLAMIDSSTWPGIFFWITVTSVLILNVAGGIYQNSVFGMAAKLPGKYTGAVVLGSNISGVFTAIASMLAKEFSPHPRTAAIYYFITALFVLLACFDTYFALPINRYYRYYNQLHQEEVDKKQREIQRNMSGKTPHWKVFKHCWVQCFNVWFTLCVTLSIFPVMHSDIQRSDPNFFITDFYYQNVMCFLVFNITAMLGSWIGTKVHWPSKKYLIIPVLMRVVFIPLFLYCNYRPKNVVRVLPIYIEDDWIFGGLGVVMGLTSGYFSTLAMQYGPTTVEKQYSTTAGMFGAAFLVTGVLSGILLAFLMPVIVSTVSYDIRDLYDEVKKLILESFDK